MHILKEKKGDVWSEMVPSPRYAWEARQENKKRNVKNVKQMNRIKANVPAAYWLLMEAMTVD